MRTIKMENKIIPNEKVVDAELEEMIKRLDNTPCPSLKFDVNDYLKIYNWLKELELYKHLYGSLNNTRR